MGALEVLWIKSGVLSPWIFCAKILALLFITDRIVHSLLNALATKSPANKHVLRNAVINAFNATFRGLIWVTKLPCHQMIFPAK